MLTERQQDILGFIQNEQREKGLTPSTREIQRHFGYASQTSVMQYLAALEKKGFLDRHARKARALVTPGQKARITDIPIYGQIPAGMAGATEEARPQGPGAGHSRTKSADHRYPNLRADSRRNGRSDRRGNRGPCLARYA